MMATATAILFWIVLGGFLALLAWLASVDVNKRAARGFAVVAIACVGMVVWGVCNAVRAQTADPEPSGRHGDGHARQHDIYRNWHPPLNPGTSCCNDADCRPTRAYVDGEGRWRAWNGIAWLPVPPERVLPPDYAGDGRSHLCERAGFIYCFTPGETKS